MCLGQSVGNLRRDFNRLAYRQQVSFQQLAQRLSLYQLHRNIVRGTLLSAFVNRDNVGMVEGRRRKRFPFKSM